MVLYYRLTRRLILIYLLSTLYCNLILYYSSKTTRERRILINKTNLIPRLFETIERCGIISHNKLIEVCARATQFHEKSACFCGHPRGNRHLNVVPAPLRSHNINSDRCTVVQGQSERRRGAWMVCCSVRVRVFCSSVRLRVRVFCSSVCRDSGTQPHVRDCSGVCALDGEHERLLTVHQRHEGREAEGR